MVVPTEALKESPVLMEITDESALVRIVRWGELVSMVLHDSQIADLPKWAKVLGISVPSSEEVAEFERMESDARMDVVDHLRAVIQPMIQILAVPTMVSLIATMAANADAEIDSETGRPLAAAAEVGISVSEALRQSMMSVLSVLVDLELISINDLQEPAALAEVEEDDE